MDLLTQADQPHFEYSAEITQVVYENYRKRPKGPRKGLRAEIPQPDNPFIRHIPLSRGFYAVVDTHLYDWLMQWNWYVCGRPRLWYATTCLKTVDGVHEKVRMHTFIMGIKPGDKRKGDHKDRDALNNTGANLRYADDTQSARNRARLRSNSSGYIGVHWCKVRSKWVARITVDGHRIIVCESESKEEAACAYDSAAREHYGEFAVLNFPIAAA